VLPIKEKPVSEQTVAVVLSGCGVMDGAEVTEAVGLIVSLSQAGFGMAFYAPDRFQANVIDHYRGVAAGESRNILSEAARIARGNIKPLSAIRPEAHCAIVFPGCFGAAKNLCNFAEAGGRANLYEDVQAALSPFVEERKPIVALCAAPLVLGLIARNCGISGSRITFGGYAEGKAMVDALGVWGQTHVEMPVDGACVDEGHRFVSVPAYMYGGATPAQVFAGCQAAVAALKQLLS